MEIKRGCCGELTCLTLAVFSQSKDICSSGVTCLVMSSSQEGTLFSFGLLKLKLGIYKINMYRCSKTSIWGVGMRRREEEERGEGEGRKKEKLIEKGTSPNELGGRVLKFIVCVFWKADLLLGRLYEFCLCEHVIVSVLSIRRGSLNHLLLFLVK